MPIGAGRAIFHGSSQAGLLPLASLAVGWRIGGLSAPSPPEAPFDLIKGGVLPAGVHVRPLPKGAQIMPAHGSRVRPCNLIELVLWPWGVVRGFDEERVQGVKVLTFGEPFHMYSG